MFSPLRFLVPVVSLASPILASAAEVETLAGQPVTVLARTVVEVPNGTVTYLRIRPPVLQPKPAPPPPAPAAPLSPEQQAALDLAESKTHATLTLTAIVYTRADDSAAVTELTWRDGERSFRAWSTADWRLLRQLNDIETETHRFQYFPFVDAQPLAELPPAQQPAGLALFPAAPVPGALPEYYLEGTESDAVAAGPVLDALDHLLAIYHVRHAELVVQLADLARREAEAADQARLAVLEAAKPRHEKVFFWKIQ
jgi:hypothetical protein